MKSIFLSLIFRVAPLMADEIKTDKLPIAYKDAQEIMADAKIDGKRKHFKKPNQDILGVMNVRVIQDGVAKIPVNTGNSASPQATSVSPSRETWNADSISATPSNLEQALTQVKLGWASQSMMNALYKEWRSGVMGESFQLINEDARQYVLAEFQKEKGKKTK